MTTLTLGHSPSTLIVNLEPGADFIAAVVRESGAWSTGTQATIDFKNGTTWTATITTTTVANDTLTWNVDQIAVDALVALAPSTAALWYVLGAVKIKWADGPVVIRNA
jgi:hypothetical protein